MRSQSSQLLAKSLATQMSFLEQLSTIRFRGKIIVTYANGDKSQPIEGYLESFIPKKHVEISPEEGVRSSLPLLGNVCAVKRIIDNGGSILYENPLVNETYPIKSNAIRKKCGFT